MAWRRTLARALFPATTFTLLLLVGAEAFAQPAPAAGGSGTAAESLFHEGRDAMGKKDYATACARFEASEREEASAGTLLNLADCYEQLGKLASAWGTFKAAARMASDRGRKDWAEGADTRAAALAPRLTKLRIDVSDGAARRAGLVIKRDGAVLPPGERGVAIPVDSGPHEVEATADGAAPFTTSVAATKEADTLEVTIPPLEASAGGAASPVAQIPVYKGEAAGGGSWQLPTAITLAGLGVVGLAVGAIEGLAAQSALDDLKTTCHGDLHHCPAGTTSDKFDSASTLSTVGFVVGGALVAGGAVIFLTRPKEASSASGVSLAPSVGPGRAGARLTLRF